MFSWLSLNCVGLTIKPEVLKTLWEAQTDPAMHIYFLVKSESWGRVLDLLSNDFWYFVIYLILIFQLITLWQEYSRSWDGTIAFFSPWILEGSHLKSPFFFWQIGLPGSGTWLWLLLGSVCLPTWSRRRRLTSSLPETNTLHFPSRNWVFLFIIDRCGNFPCQWEDRWEGGMLLSTSGISEGTVCSEDFFQGL